MGSKPTIILVDVVFYEKEHAIFEKKQCFPGNCTHAAWRLWGQEWNCTVASDFTRSIAKQSEVFLEANWEQWEEFFCSHICVSSENTRCVSFQWCCLQVSYSRKTLTSQCLLDKNKMISGIIPVLLAQSLICSQQNVGQNLSLLFKKVFGTEKSYSNHSCVCLDSFRISHHVSTTRAGRDHLTAAIFLLTQLRKILTSF